MLDIIVACEKIASMETAEDIRHFLQDQGVKGVPAQAGRCAISAWVTDSTGVQVCTNAVGITTVGEGNCTRHVKATDAMRGFMSNFDTYQYPELIVPRLLRHTESE